MRKVSTQMSAPDIRASRLLFPISLKNKNSSGGEAARLLAKSKSGIYCGNRCKKNKKLAWLRQFGNDTARPIKSRPRDGKLPLCTSTWPRLCSLTSPNARKQRRPRRSSPAPLWFIDMKRGGQAPIIHEEPVQRQLGSVVRAGLH